MATKHDKALATKMAQAFSQHPKYGKLGDGRILELVDKLIQAAPKIIALIEAFAPIIALFGDKPTPAPSKAPKAKKAK